MIKEGGKIMDFKKILQNIIQKPNNKNMINLLIIFLIGIFLLIAASDFKNFEKNAAVINSKNDKSEKNINRPNGVVTYEERELEDKLKNTLEMIDGVGRVEVMVYFESGEEQIPAFNTTDATSFTEEKDNEGGKRNTTEKNSGSTVVITNDGSKSEPLIIKKYKPKVSGVIVVAEGAEDKAIEYKISKAVVNLFNVSLDKVNVYAMKK